MLESGVQDSANVVAFSLSLFPQLLSAFPMGGIDNWGLELLCCLPDCVVIFRDRRNIVLESFILRIC
jgi:hypothetical protein